MEVSKNKNIIDQKIIEYFKLALESKILVNGLFIFLIMESYGYMESLVKINRTIGGVPRSLIFAMEMCLIPMFLYVGYLLNGVINKYIGHKFMMKKNYWVYILIGYVILFYILFKFPTHIKGGM